MIEDVFKEQPSASGRRFLHVLNGDATRGKLERSAVPGTFAVWADVLHDGPCRLVAADEWRRMRARFLASQGFLPEAEILDSYGRWDSQLAAFSEYDEVVFWFEHDLFDQLLLIRHLHWLAYSRGESATQFSLICIGAFPGVPDFIGLGPLTPDQLASLLDTRHAITAGEVRLGVRAWERFCSPDPSRLVSMLSEDTTALPFLDGALRRFLADYPALGTGLSRSERQILEAVAAGASSPADVFLATQQMEERVFMGDWSYWTITRGLAAARRPLLAIDAGPANRSLPQGQIHLTDRGRDVLAGRADHVAINGIDRWMGGVHVTDGRWRWTGETLELRP
jgi:hypothetical protein